MTWGSQKVPGFWPIPISSHHKIRSEPVEPVEAADFTGSHRQDPGFPHGDATGGYVRSLHRWCMVMPRAPDWGDQHIPSGYVNIAIENDHL